MLSSRVSRRRGTFRAWGEARADLSVIGMQLPSMQLNPVSADDASLEDRLRWTAGFVAIPFVLTDYRIVLLYTLGQRRALTSNFGWVVADVGRWVDEPADLPFEADVGVAGTDPNEETVADLGGTDAGEEEVGAGSLSVLPREIMSMAVHTTWLRGVRRASCAILE